MLASDNTCTSIVLLQTYVAIEVVAIDADAGATGLMCITTISWVIDAIVQHSHLHLNMKSVTSPVRHIVFKFILHHDYRWVVSIAEIRVFNVYGTSSRSYVILEVVARKDDRPSVSLNHERRHIFKLVNDKRVIKFCVRIDDFLEKVTAMPDLIYALFELQICLSNVCELNNHFLVI